MAFADNFKRLCMERGLTPTAVCRQIGIADNAVTRWLHGSTPKERQLIAIAKVLNCSIGDLFDSVGKDVDYTIDLGNGVSLLVETSASLPSVSDREDLAELYAIYSKLSRKDRHIFMGTAYEMASKEEN